MRRKAENISIHFEHENDGSLVYVLTYDTDPFERSNRRLKKLGRATTRFTRIMLEE